MNVFDDFELIILEEVPLYTPKGKRIAQAQASSFPPGWHPDVAAKSQTQTKANKQQQSKNAAVSLKIF